MKEKQPEPISLAKAQEQLERISVHRAQLVADQIRLDQRLKSVRRDLGRKYLEGDRSGLQEAADISAELDAISSALTVLEEHDALGKVELEGAKARDLHNQAARKKDQLEALELQTTKLLASLSELEGVEFTVSILSAQPAAGMWVSPETLKEPAPWLALTELCPKVPNQPGSICLPLSRKLRIEIEQLEHQAWEIEHRLEHGY